MIMALKNEMGDWIFNEDKLHHEVIHFFENLYGENQTFLRGHPMSSFSKLEDDEIHFLNKLVSSEEIESTMFDMGPLKDRGSEGFHALFF